MKKSRFKVVIYDCDGVMLDSIESNYVFYNRVMEYLGRPHLDRSNVEARKALHTFSFHNVMEYFFGQDERREEALAFAKTIQYRDLVQYMQMEHGLIDTLDCLKGNVQLAICTNRASSMEMIIEDFGLTGYFSCVMTASQVMNPKPHPEPLLKILEHYSISADEALFVGDAEVDMQSAAAAGVSFIAYKNTLPAMGCIDHHSQIISYVFGED